MNMVVSFLPWGDIIRTLTILLWYLGILIFSFYWITFPVTFGVFTIWNIFGYSFLITWNTLIDYDDYRWNKKIHSKILEG